jgi:hypothetical protein
VAGGGAYGASNNRSFNVSGTGNCCIFGINGITGTVDPSGWSGAAVAGVNLVFGPLLVGLEMDGRFGGERQDKGGSPAQPQTTLVTDPKLTLAPMYSYRYRDEGAVHVAGRIGAAFNDTMVYFKIGGGLARIAETFTADETGVSFCTQSGVLITPPFTVETICAVREQGGAASAVERHWRPSVLVGVGAEQNVGRFFGRLYGDMEFISLQTTTVNGVPLSANRTLLGSSSQQDLQWSARMGALIGVRF